MIGLGDLSLVEFQDECFDIGWRHLDDWISENGEPDEPYDYTRY